MVLTMNASTVSRTAASSRVGYMTLEMGGVGGCGASCQRPERVSKEMRKSDSRADCFHATMRTDWLLDDIVVTRVNSSEEMGGSKDADVSRTRNGAGGN